MLKIVVGAILGMAGSQAQKAQPLLLPEARHIAGVVVDAQGKPVAEASVDHTYDQLHAHKTDPEGRFELDTRAPAVVVRRAGYRSEVIRTMDATQVRVMLRKLDEAVSSLFSRWTVRGNRRMGRRRSVQNTPGIMAGPKSGTLITVHEIITSIPKMDAAESGTAAERSGALEYHSTKTSGSPSHTKRSSSKTER